MAKEKETGFVSLSQEAKDRLEAMGKEIEETEKDLARLEELGLDTSRLRDQVEWVKKARKVLKDKT